MDRIPLNVTLTLFHTPEGKVTVNTEVINDTVWLTAQTIADIFDIDVAGIPAMVQAAYPDAGAKAAAKQGKVAFAVSSEDKKGNIIYPIDVVMAIGYRANTEKAALFRQWANAVLREYDINGYAFNAPRIKTGHNALGQEVFTSLVSTLDTARASEIYLRRQLDAIFARCGIDYSSHSPDIRNGYASIQNSFYYAITGQTAPEIIETHADPAKENMGLKTWKRAPDGHILKADAHVAENYLTAEQANGLAEALRACLLYVSRLNLAGRTWTMEEFTQTIDQFLKFYGYPILKHKGTVSHQQALEKANQAYDAYFPDHRKTHPHKQEKAVTG